MKRLTLIVGFLLIWGKFLGQENNIRFDHITTKDGLPHSLVFSIHQDVKGFMWFGTSNGLARYDGYDLKVFQPDPKNYSSLSHKSVYRIYGDNQDNLWIVFQNNGVDKFNLKTEQFIHFSHDDSDKNSLSWNEITCYLSDSRGNIWLGTSNGLNRYNLSISGFDKYFATSSPNSIPHNYITDLKEDSKGNIWIATFNGIAVLRSSGKIEKLGQLLNKTSLTDIKINKISIDKEDNIWFSTYGLGLLCYNDQKASLQIYCSKKNNDNLPEKEINALYINRLGDVFTFSAFPNNHMFLLKKNENRFYKYHFPDENPSLSINSIDEDRNHNLFIASEYLIEFNYNENTFYTFKKDIPEEGSINGNRIQTLFIDKDNNLWVSIYKVGIDKASLEKKGFRSYTKSNFSFAKLTENNVVPIIQDKKGNFWLGIQNHSLVKFNSKWEKVKEYFTSEKPNPNNLSNNNFASLCEDKNGNIWVGSFGGGIDVINTKTKQVRHFSTKGKGKDFFTGSSIRKIVSDSAGNLWLATLNKGIIQYLSDKDEFVYHSLNCDSLFKEAGFYRTIYIDRKNTIWLGSQAGGLQHFDPHTCKFKNYRNAKGNNRSISSNTVYCILQDTDSTYWIGTAGGLNYFNKISGTFKHFTTHDGLCNNTIYSIIPDKKGTLWISTDNGLANFDPKNQIFTNYYEGDGLVSNEFNSGSSLRSSKGELFFGTPKGMISFFPAQLKLMPYKSTPVITNLKILNNAVSVGDTLLGKVILKQSPVYIKEIELLHSHNAFSIEFSALHYSSPQKIRYQYMLEGFDTCWNSTDSKYRNATYTNLPSGKYLFRLRCSNEDGVWDGPEDELTLKINIIPPFWETLWFRTLIVLIILYIILFVYLLRTRMLRKQKEMLEQMVKKRTGQLEEANAVLEEKQEEIYIQNEELQMQKETLQETNRTLEEQQQEILIQNEELEQYRNKLENLVQERTSELEKAMEKAKESERLKSSFLANMSHEIRTPMNAIVGFSSLLGNSELSKNEVQSFTTHIKKNSEALLVLIDDILDLSKIQANQLNLYPKPVKVVELLQELYEVFRLQTNSKKLDLHLNLGLCDENIVCETDPFRLKQILSNLLSNAIKFTSSGYIEFGIEPGEEKFLKFFVKDTGIGISKETGDRIFDRFLKVENSKLQLYGGTGLGLAISRSLVEMFGGKIWYQSVEGQGSIFYFTVPGNFIKGNSHTNNNTMEEIIIPNLKGKKILIAEDEEANYLILAAYVAKTKATVSWAKNGAEAVDMVTQHDFDLVLMDIKMPVLDGLSATEQIKQLKPDLEIVAQTAFALEEEKREFSKFGFYAYLTKPLIIREIMDVLRRVFEKQA